MNFHKDGIVISDMVCYYSQVNLIVILIKSDGGNRPYEVQQPVMHGAKSYG